MQVFILFFDRPAVTAGATERPSLATPNPAIYRIHRRLSRPRGSQPHDVVEDDRDD